MTKLAVILLIMGLIAVAPSSFAATGNQNSNIRTIQSSGDPIFMQYEGITAPNGGACSGIHLDSFQWGVGRDFTHSATGDREVSAPSVSEAVVTKQTDSTSPKLLNEALQGEGKSVHIDFCKGDKGKLSPYLQFDLANTLISGFKMSSGGDRPTESISLNFVKVTMSMPGGDSMSWDLATAKGVLIGLTPTPPPGTLNNNGQ